jgi:hypothetical protein
MTGITRTLLRHAHDQASAWLVVEGYSRQKALNQLSYGQRRA